jgi:hypothetical protein
MSVTMKRIFWVYLALLLLGLVVLAWPEQNNVMMIQLSETHGPSKMDLAGILIIMMGYLPMVKEVWKQSSETKTYIGIRSWNILLVVTFISMSGIAWGLYSGSDITLWISVVVATIAQSILVRVAYRRV